MSLIRGEIFVLRCWNDYMSDSINLYGLVLNPSLPRNKSIVRVAKQLEFEELTDEQRAERESRGGWTPMLKMSSAEAQALMDRLFECGVRPTQAFGEVGAISAMKENLADLRKINENLFRVVDSKIDNGLRGER